ncbi:MAG: alpha/beta fold hydrolase [Kofleriaceae bacterium]
MVTPQQWRSRGDTRFVWGGHPIFTRIEGTGEPLLLVHGFPTASWDFAAIWPALTARFRVVTLDMLGFGFSAKPKHFAYSIAAQVDLIEALLANAGIERFRVLAHDLGLTVLQELLARDANIVSACMLNGGLFPEAHRPLVMQRLLASPLGPVIARFGTFGTFASQMRRIWGTTPPTDDELRAMWELVSRDRGAAVMPRLLGYMAERRSNRERWVGALVNAEVPIRLINGLADPISGAHMVARYRELIRDPDVVELPGVGHYPHVEAADQVTEALFSHAASHPFGEDRRGRSAP